MPDFDEYRFSMDLQELLRKHGLSTWSHDFRKPPRHFWERKAAPRIYVLEIKGEIKGAARA